MKTTDTIGRNPTRWMKRTIARTTAGVTEATRRLARAAKALMNKALEDEPPLLLDLAVIWARQLLLTAIEVVVGWFFKNLTRPKPGRLIRLRPAN
jgi:hypothetical protein